MASDPLEPDRNATEMSMLIPSVLDLNPVHSLSFSGIATTFRQSPDPSSSAAEGCITHDASLGAARTGRFDYFAIVPAEIRAKILSFLVESAIINIDATKLPTVFIYRTRMMESCGTGQTGTGRLALPDGSSAASAASLAALLGSNNALTGVNQPSIFSNPSGTGKNWLTISKRFFREARVEIWKIVPVRFERRYDMIMAFVNRSLHADPEDDTPRGFDNLSMCPLETNVFQRISHLQLNLTSSTDFAGMITNHEARRVTQVICNIAKRNMPALSKLVLFLDKQARVHDTVFILLPAAWFLKALLSIKQLKCIKLIPGSDFSGLGDVKAVAQRCIKVLSEVLLDDLEEKVDRYRLGWKTRSGTALQAKVGRRMMDILEVICENCQCQGMVPKPLICFTCKTPRAAMKRFHTFYRVSSNNS